MGTPDIILNRREMLSKRSQRIISYKNLFYLSQQERIIRSEMDFSRTPQIILTTLLVSASRGKAVSLDLEYQVHSQSRSEAEFVYLLWEDCGETLGLMTTKNKFLLSQKYFYTNVHRFLQLSQSESFFKGQSCRAGLGLHAICLSLDILTF